MLRERLSIIAWLGILTLSQAQTITVADKTTLRPVEGAVLTSEAPKASVVTDALGHADIATLNGSSAITITHVSYRSLTVSHTELAGLSGPLLLSERAYPLEEFVLSASRFKERERDVPEKIDILKSTDIAHTDAQTTGDLLLNTGTTFVQKSQMEGSSPVIRGFEASRILLVVDGIRMNNAIYRSGHLQDIITVDQNALERVEVISGPGSVIYGSDALGGVIHMMTRTPKFLGADGRKVGGDAFFRTSTANSELTAHAGFELRGAKLASYTSITASDFGICGKAARATPSMASSGPGLSRSLRRTARTK